ncbi:MAG: hypothetical protein KQH63_14635 [Desulfobulbaceae bacterium]|nr:hypothetical protein [Desulfobulbaceae bacterium]
MPGINGKQALKKSSALVSAFWLMAVLLLLPSVARAADRLYFVSIVEADSQQGGTQVLLEWGPLEGSIPTEIENFRLYRSINGKPFDPLAEIANQVAAPSVIRGYVQGDINEQRRSELLSILQEMSDSLVPPGPQVTEDNCAEFIHDIISPSSNLYNPLQRMLLVRFHPAVARAAGLAFIDDKIEGEAAQYMLTGVTARGESLPIGKTEEFDPGIPTVLPPPTGLKQVEIGGCSALHKNLDDLRIHLLWDVPAQPQDISLNVLTYGYDVYWSEDDKGLLDFRAGVPEGLFKVNRKPVIVSGAAPAEGKDGFLARDSQENHLTGPIWQRGQNFYYYLVSRDLAGNYSYAGLPIEATVVDTEPPVSPWRLHTEELSDVIGSNATPRLSLVWDKINPVNYIRYFGTDRAVCSTTDSQVCTAPTDDACTDPAQVRCVDLNVTRYHVFRFSSPAAASAWGTDTDGDLWPDNLENSPEEACDADTYPGGVAPVELAATLDQNNPDVQRDLAAMHQQMVFVDSAIRVDDYNHIFYYRVLAEDGSGNFSALSAPIRGVLYDRNQPDVNASMQALDCDNYSTDHLSTDVYREPGDILTLVDKTGKAASFRLVRHCQGTSTYVPDETPLRGKFIDGFAHINPESFDPSGCDAPQCTGGLVSDYQVFFYNDKGLPMAASTAFDMPQLCSTDYYGAILLDDICLWTMTTPGMVAQGPVMVCAELSDGQTARVYNETGGEMSPVATIEYDSDPDNGGQSCIELADMAGLVTADLCLGVRIFSANHVGSGMSYFNCLEMVNPTGPIPPPPLIEGLYSKETAGGEPYFDLRWSAPAEGQAAFVISMTSGQESRNQTVFPESRDTSGQFSQTINLDPATDSGKEWCVKMRTIATSMQTSDWSRQVCATWTATEPENLPWPRVNEPVPTGDVSAFFMKEGSYWGRPVLMLSSNLSLMLTALPCTDGPCINEVPVCDGTNTCIGRGEYDGEIYDEAVNFSSALPAQYIPPLVSLKNFLLYRQEEGRDFIQVSPLVEGFSFQQVWIDVGGGSHYDWRLFHQLRDPFYFLRNFSEGAISGVDPKTGSAIDAAEHSGVRMVFLDRYPYVAGSTVRYKLVLFDPATGEPKTIKTSNWLTLP